MRQHRKVTSKESNSKIKQLIEDGYGKRKLDSIEDFRIAAKNFNVGELLFYEFLNLILKKSKQDK